MKVSDLHPDKRNARKRNKRANEVIQHSLRELGAGRSVLVDRNNQLIAGNGVVENAATAGITDVQIVESDGSKLIVVKRTDLDLDQDPKARELAIADNRSAELAEWNPEMLADLSSELDLQPFFTANELSVVTGQPAEANDVSAEYTGMPEYTSTDQTGVRSIIVHFESHEAVAEFAKRLEHPLTPDTKSIWFPRAERLDLQSEKYV